MNPRNPHPPAAAGLPALLAPLLLFPGVSPEILARHLPAPDPPSVSGETRFAADTVPPGAWDASLLEEGIRRYDVYIQGSPMGSAEYRLEREGDEWVSTSMIAALAIQESRLRFGVDDFAPRALEVGGGEGPMGMAADLRVEDGRLVGSVTLPEQLGGTREVDRPISPDTLLPGMDEYVLQVSDLEEGAVVRLPVLDLVRDEVSVMEARVTGRESIRVGAGTFETWRLEVTGGTDPLVLHLRAEAPHILVRQEYRARPVRLDLSAHGTIR
jgi:hypothetical protein